MAPDGAGPGGGVSTFQPASVTFVSAAMGYVLGVAPCPGSPCTAVRHTTDGGRTWTATAAAPAAALSPLTKSDEVGGVRSIRFATTQDGWIFGPALYATHDGARTWHPVSLAGAVSSLEAAAGRVYAIVIACPGGAASCGSGSAALWQATTRTDDWHKVMDLGTASSAAGASTLVLHGTSGWAVLPAGSADGPRLWSSQGGKAWTQATDPCKHDQFSLGQVAATDSSVFLLCFGSGFTGNEEKQLLVSADGGRTSRAAGTPPSSGTVAMLAAANSATLVMAAWSGASNLERSTNGGQAWTMAASFPDGGQGFVDLGFTTTRQGIVIHGYPGRDVDDLLVTRDGGASWAPARF